MPLLYETYEAAEAFFGRYIDDAGVVAIDSLFADIASADSPTLAPLLRWQTHVSARELYHALVHMKPPLDNVSRVARELLTSGRARLVCVRAGTFEALGASSFVELFATASDADIISRCVKISYKRKYATYPWRSMRKTAFHCVVALAADTMKRVDPSKAELYAVERAVWEKITIRREPRNGIGFYALLAEVRAAQYEFATATALTAEIVSIMRDQQ